MFVQSSWKPVVVIDAGLQDKSTPTWMERFTVVFELMF